MARHETVVCDFDYTQKIGVWRGHPPAPPLSAWPTISDKILERVARRDDTLVHSVEGRVGRGALSRDPYLLRVVEAANHSLVAGQSAEAECDSAWSRESGPPPLPLREVTPRPPRAARSVREFRGREHAGIALREASA